MRILTIASQKGGAGKTTLAAHLAVEAERTGAGPVAVVDIDPQGSLAAWWNSREAQAPLFASVEIARLPDHLNTLQRRQVELVVIDTPPALTETIRAAITVADLVLIPARPSPHDLRAVGVIVEMAEAGQHLLLLCGQWRHPAHHHRPGGGSRPSPAWQGGPGNPTPTHRLRREHGRRPHRGRAQPAVSLGRGGGVVMAIRDNAVT